MATPTIDYDELAKKFGGSDTPTSPAPTSGAVDYDKLAAQFGGSDKPLTAKPAGPDFAAISRQMEANPPGVPKPPIPEELKPDEQRIAESGTRRNPRTGLPMRDLPTGMGNPLTNMLDTAVTGPTTFLEGAAKAAEPAEILFGKVPPMATGVQVPPLDKARASSEQVKDLAEGTHKMISGAMEASTPLIAGAGAVAPVATGLTLGGAMGAQTAVEHGLQALGMDPRYAGLVGDLAGLVAGAAVHRYTAPVDAYIKSEIQKRVKGQLPDGGSPGEPPPPSSTGTTAGSPMPPSSETAPGNGLKTPSNPSAAPTSPDNSTVTPVGPPPPTKTDTPGPRTPVLPTAAAQTIPEPPETLNLQLQQMTEGKRKVVMVPKSNLDAGFEPAAPVPAGVSMTSDAFGNRYYYDRQQGITKAQVRSAVQNNTLPELLGGPEGMGAPDKSAIDPASAVVVKATAPDGTEAQSTATPPELVPQTVAATQHVVPEGGKLEIQPPEQAIQERGLPAPQPVGSGILKLESHDKYPTAQEFRYDVPDANGQSLGNVRVLIHDADPATAQLAFYTNEEHPSLVGKPDTPAGPKLNVGPTDVRRVVRELQALHPEVQKFTMPRVTGIHAGTEQLGELPGYRARRPEPVEAPARLEAPEPVGAKPKTTPPPQDDFFARRAARQAESTERPTYADYLRESERTRKPGEPPMPRDMWERRQSGIGDDVKEFLKSEEGTFTPAQAAQHIAEVMEPLNDSARRLVAPQTRGDTAEVGAGTVRHMEGKRMRIEAIAKAAFEAFREHFQKMRPVYQANSPGKNGIHGFDVIDAIERGPAAIAKLDPTSQQFAKRMATEMDYWKGELKKRGLMENFRDNFFHRSWVQPTAKGRMREFFRGRKPLEGSKQYTKQRTYDYMADAMNDTGFDLVPKFDNPVDYVLDYVAQAAKHVTAHDVFNEWKKSGYLHFFRNPKDVPEGYSKINDNMFTVYGPKHGAVKLPWSAIDAVSGDPIKPSDVEVFGHREMGHYYAPDELARVANNFLSLGAEGTAGAPLFKTWMAIKGAQNQMNLGFSAFHGVTTTLNSSISDLALAMRDLASGNYKKAAGEAADFAVPFKSVVRDYIRGTYLEKVYEGKVKDPVAEAMIQQLEKAGGSPHQSVFDMDRFYRGMKKSWDEGAKGSAVLKALNPLLWSEQFPATRFIMGKLVPRVKIAVFERAMAQEAARHPGMGLEEARSRAGAVWDSVDDAFGHLNQKNMLMTNGIRDLMNGLIGRPGWTVGNLRMVLGGASDIIKMVKGSDGTYSKKPELTYRGAQFLASLLGAAMVNGTISSIVKAMSDKDDEPLNWRDLVAPRSGGFTEDGRPARMILPFYLSKDYRSWVTHPTRTAKAKLTGVLMMAADLAENRDFFRHKIYGEGGIGLLKYMAELWGPYSATGSLQNYERGQKPLQIALPQVGIMPAPREVSMTPAEKIIYDWKNDHQPEMRGATTSHSRAKQKVFMEAKQKGEDAGKTLAEKYVNEGVLTPREAKDQVAKAGKTPLLNDVKYMTGEGAIRTVIKVYDAATPKERDQIKDEVKKKLQNARTKPWEWDAKTKELAKRHFNVEPSRTIGTPSPVGAER